VLAIGLAAYKGFMAFVSGEYKEEIPEEAAKKGIDPD